MNKTNTIYCAIMAKNPCRKDKTRDRDGFFAIAQMWLTARGVCAAYVGVMKRDLENAADCPAGTRGKTHGQVMDEASQLLDIEQE